MDALRWQDQSLSLLDQAKYPAEEVWIDCPDYRTTLELLKTPAVQGDTILTVAGAYAWALAALEYQNDPAFEEKVAEAKLELLSSLPAVPALPAALEQMQQLFDSYRGTDQAATALVAAAVIVHRQDVVASRAMNRHGAGIVPDGARIVLSCSQGILHTGAFAHAIGTARSAGAKRKVERVFVCEHRPGLEGALAVSRELAANKVPASLITDHTAASLMPRKSCDLVLTDAIKVSAGGDVLAAPGTYELAVAAYFHSIQFYVNVFTAEIDLALPALNLADPDSIPALWEQADPETVAQFAGVSIRPEQVDVWAPAYDVVPNYLITGLITEKGILFQPNPESVTEFLSDSAQQAPGVL